MVRGVLQAIMLPSAALLGGLARLAQGGAERPAPPPIVVMNDHAEALPVWVAAAEAAEAEGQAPGPYAVLHVDRHSDMNMPSAEFAASPAALLDSGAQPRSAHERAALRAAAVREADLASFQMAGVWAGVVGSIAWVHGNASEPFLLTLTGELEARCAGLSCPMPQSLRIQHDEETGHYFDLSDRSAGPAGVSPPVGASALVFDGGLSPGVELEPSPHRAAPFDFWVGAVSGSPSALQCV